MSRREVPPALNGEQQAELKAAVQELPSQAGIELSNWNWKAMRRYVGERFRQVLSRSSCRNYRHRLGFVLKRPKKQLVKADPSVPRQLNMPNCIASLKTLPTPNGCLN